MELNDIISSGLLELYALGLSTPEETAQVEQWAAQYAEVRAEIEAIRSGMERYAMSHSVAPSASVKDKLMKQIGGDDDEIKTPLITMNDNSTKVRSISPAWRWAAAASIILLIGTAIFTYNFYNKYNSANKDLAAVQDQLKGQQNVLDSIKGYMKMVQDTAAIPVALKKTPEGEGQAKVYWMKDRNGEVYVDPSNLPAPPKGKQYQFWAIIDGKPVSGGMIDLFVGGKQVYVQKMKSFTGNVQAFAISLEDAGPEKEAPAKVMNVGGPTL